MVYQTDEASDAGGLPVLLIHFSDSIGHNYRYTTYHDTITYGGFDYEPEVIDVEPIKLAEEIVSNEVYIRIGKGNSLITMYIAGPSEDVMEVTIYRGHSGDYVTRWSGFVMSAVVDENGSAKFRCEPRTSSMRRVGRRRTVQRLCDLVLYSQGTGECNVVEASFTVSGVIASISGTTITATIFGTKSDDWFQGGKLITNGGSGNREKRLILSHTGTSITISRALRNADVGDALTASAGCDHLPTTCLNKFSNKDNYGGSEFLPVLNPFDHNILYGTP